jgi:LacI family transcriptional regulator
MRLPANDLTRTGSPTRSRKTPACKLPRVALLLETSTEYGRGLLRGIVKYVRLHGPWEFSVAPGHFEHVLPRPDAWSGHGIIARIRSPEMASLIRLKRLPFVASSLAESGSLFCGDCFGEIRTSSKAIAMMAVNHLLDQGLRQFAFCGFIGCPWSMRREKVFHDAVRLAGFPCSTYRVHMANWLQSPSWMKTWEREQPALMEWLKSLPKPVGVMACNDSCGCNVLQACARAELRVPEDVAVTGVDNDEMMCEVSSPRLSSVALDLEKAGYMAAKLLDDLMSGKPCDGRLVQVEPTHVVARESTDVIVQQDPVVANALRFIRNHAGKAIGVSEVAEGVGVCRRTLERRFSRAIGRSPLKEIARCRVERAKRLLMETDLPQHRVAAAAGFGGLRALNRTFRELEGVAPGSFRAALRTSFRTELSAPSSTIQGMATPPSGTTEAYKKAR